MEEILSINPFANLFFFGDFNVHHNYCLTYSGGTDISSELSQMTLLRWLTFLLGSLTVTLTVLLFWISFFLVMLVCSTVGFPSLGNSDHVVSVSIDFPSNSKQDAPFHCIACGYS